MQQFMFRGIRKLSASTRAATLAAVLAAVPITAVPASAEEAAAVVGTITMEGRGSVTVAPDMAVITARVVTVAKTAAEALSANTAGLTKVIDQFKASGIDAKDIQTSGFAIYPRYDRVTDNSGRQPDITGYEVRNGVDVNVRDLAQLGDLLNKAVESGANSVDGIRFQVSDPDEKLDEARKKAVAAARHKAEIFAAAADVNLGRILSISETGTQVPRPVMMRAERMMMANAAPVPVEAGEETISASVTIQWRLAGQDQK